MHFLVAAFHGLIASNPINRRKHRRIAYTWLNDKAVESYTDVLDREATAMIKAMIEESAGGSLPICPQVREYLFLLLTSDQVRFPMEKDVLNKFSSSRNTPAVVHSTT